MAIEESKEMYNIIWNHHQQMCTHILGVFRMTLAKGEKIPYLA